MKKGPVCYLYYAIKNKRKTKLEQKRELSEKEDVPSQAEIYNYQ